MNRPWKIVIVAVAVLALAGGVSGFVAAQTGGDPARPFSNFLTRLAENLGITEEELQGAIDQTATEIVDEKEAAGDLSAEQAARIRERIASGEGFPFGRGHGFGFGGEFRFKGGHGFGFGEEFRFKGSFKFSFGFGFGHLGAGSDDLAACLGLSTADDLSAASADGKTLAQIGADQGKTRDEVKACVAAPLQKLREQAVADGKLDQARADEIMESFEAVLDAIVDGTGGGGFPFKMGDFKAGDFSSFPWRFRHDFPHGNLPLEEPAGSSIIF